MCLADHHDHALDQERLDRTLTEFMADVLPCGCPVGARQLIWTSWQVLRAGLWEICYRTLESLWGRRDLRVPR